MGAVSRSVVGGERDREREEETVREEKRLGRTQLDSTQAYCRRHRHLDCSFMISSTTPAHPLTPFLIISLCENQYGSWSTVWFKCQPLILSSLFNSCEPLCHYPTPLVLPLLNRQTLYGKYVQLSLPSSTCLDGVITLMLCHCDNKTMVNTTVTSDMKLFINKPRL